jgi:YggT family protein
MEQILCAALTVYWVILIAVQVFGGRIPPALDPVARIIFDLTEPVLGLFRRYIPPLGMFDISVIFVFIILAIIQRALCS